VTPACCARPQVLLKEYGGENETAFPQTEPYTDDMAAAASAAEGQYGVVVASGKAEDLVVGVVGPSTVSWSFSLPQHNIVFRAEFRPPGLHANLVQTSS
jgi:hypothetical protein